MPGNGGSRQVGGAIAKNIHHRDVRSVALRGGFRLREGQQHRVIKNGAQRFKWDAGGEISANG